MGDIAAIGPCPATAFHCQGPSRFGTYEDAMTASSWHLSHSLLSPSLNIGLLMPHEVCDAVEDAYRSGAVPITSPQRA